MRRRVVTSGPASTAIVKCPRCCSGVMPLKGKLWGWWCPTCGARLVLEALVHPRNIL
jgi:tRNA(Ile2) C34 agmatinyltransferase TiaS